MNEQTALLVREREQLQHKINVLSGALRKVAIRHNVNSWPVSYSCSCCGKCVYTVKENGPDQFNTGHSYDCPLS